MTIKEKYDKENDSFRCSFGDAFGKQLDIVVNVKDQINICFDHDRENKMPLIFSLSEKQESWLLDFLNKRAVVRHGSEY